MLHWLVLVVTSIAQGEVTIARESLFKKKSPPPYLLNEILLFSTRKKLKRLFRTNTCLSTTTIIFYLCVSL